MNAQNTFRPMTARYASGFCASCNVAIREGDEILYRSSDKKIHHNACDVTAAIRASVANFTYSEWSLTYKHALDNTTLTREEAAILLGLNTEPQQKVEASKLSIPAKLLASTKPEASLAMTQAQALANLKTRAANTRAAGDRSGADEMHKMLSEYSSDIPATGRKLSDDEVISGDEPIDFTSAATEDQSVSSYAPIGDGYFTVVRADGSHVTFRIHTQAHDKNFAPGEQIISALIGSDNTSDYKGFAFVKSNQVRVWKSRAGSIGDWADLANALITGDWKAAGVEYAKQSGNCYRCNRLLTTPESIAAGIGPVCAGKE